MCRMIAWYVWVVAFFWRQASQKDLACSFLFFLPVKGGVSLSTFLICDHHLHLIPRQTVQKHQHQALLTYSRFVFDLIVSLFLIGSTIIFSVLT